MAELMVQGKSIYYEVHASRKPEGQTLVILNGIMMSCASWQPFLDALTAHVEVVLVDFFDQGKSAYFEGEAGRVYDQSLQTEVVHALLEELNRKDVTLLGISYGGEVAMRYAASEKSNGRLQRLILSNTTAYTDKQLKTIGDGWVETAKSYDGRQFFRATIPPIYSSRFYEAQYAWLKAREDLFARAFTPRWYEGFIRLVYSAEDHDQRAALSKMKVPTLVMGADDDRVTPLPCQHLLAQEIPGAVFMELKRCGHAAMYEQPVAFFSAVLGFMALGGTAFKVM